MASFSEAAWTRYFARSSSWCESSLPGVMDECLSTQDRHAYCEEVGEQIRGVHWRQRSNIDKRWVILSGIAQSTVMAHELGHFFGLPHSSHRRSIMNKTPREDPPWDERVFVDEELAIVRAERDRMFGDGSLIDR